MKRHLTTEQLTEIAQELGSNWRLFKHKEKQSMLINDQNILLYCYFTNDDKLKIYPVIYHHPIYPELEKFNYDLIHSNYSINVTFKSCKWLASNIKRRLLPDLLPKFEEAVINWKKYQEKINQAENIAHQIKAQFPALNLTKDRMYSVLSDRNLGINIKCYGQTVQLEIDTYKDFSPEAITHLLKAFYSL